MMWLGWGLAVVSIALLVGQYLAGQADIFVAIANPRPLDEELIVVTLKGWGFADQSSHAFMASAADFGLADVRVHATRTQMLTSIFSLGFLRPVTVAWRPHAGVLPLGDA